MFGKEKTYKKNELDFKNKYEYDLLLKEYQFSINRKEQFYTKVSLIMAGEFILMSREYANISNSFCNICLYKSLTVITLVLVVISLLLQISVVFMTGEYNILPYFLEDEGKYNKYDENSTVDYVTSNINQILCDRNNNYQLKTNIFNLSLVFLVISLVIYLFAQILLIL